MYVCIYIYVCVCVYACYHENNVPSVITTVALMYGYTLLVPINQNMLKNVGSECELNSWPDSSSG